MQNFVTARSLWQQDITFKERGTAGGKAATLIGITAWLYYRKIWAVPALIPLGIWLYREFLKEEKKKKEQEFQKQFREMIQSLSAALNTGYSVENAFYETQKELKILYPPEARISKELLVITRKLRIHIPVEQVLEEFAEDMQEVCPNAYFLNYTNPMAQLAGWLGRYSGIKSVGLCHSVQGCSRGLLKRLDIEYNKPIRERIAGINHMGWLLEIEDADGTDLYPEIRKRAAEVLESGVTNHDDLVRFEYIRRFGYYCTESSEHNAEYNNFFIKAKYPELIERYNIPLDEYPRRCIEQIENWKKEKDNYIHDNVSHGRTGEYASYIMEAIVTDVPYKIGGNVINRGIIPNLPDEACVEVACLVNKYGIQPCRQEPLPLQLAAMNNLMINVHLLTIEAAVTHKKDHIYQAAMLDPHTSSELSIDEIVHLCDDLIEAHGDYLPKYF